MSACGIACIFITYFIVLFVDYTVYYMETMDNANPNYVGLIWYNVIIILIFWAHIAATLGDPGVIPLGYNKLNCKALPRHVLELYRSETTNQGRFIILEEVDAIVTKISDSKKEDSKDPSLLQKKKAIFPILRKCDECKSFKPPKAHHCQECGRCIARMDHHCSWINNCVGLFTMKAFLLFLIYVFLGCAIGLILIFKNTIRLYLKLIASHDIFEGIPLSFPFIFVFGMMMAVLFLLFTGMMFWDQISYIKKSSSVIDKKQGNKYIKMSFFQSLKEYFFSTPSPLWLLPLGVGNKLVVEHEYIAIEAKSGLALNNHLKTS